MTEVGERIAQLQAVLAEAVQPQLRKRERALETLRMLLPLEPLEFSLVLKHIGAVLQSNSVPSWAQTTGALALAAAVLSRERPSPESDEVNSTLGHLETAAVRPTHKSDSEILHPMTCSSPLRCVTTLGALLDLLQGTAPTFLVHDEPAVRSAAVRALEQVVAHRGLPAWSRLVPLLLCQMEEQLVQGRRTAAVVIEPHRSVARSQETFALRSCLEAIAACMSAIHAADSLPSLILIRNAFLESDVFAQCMNHQNRFIREALLVVLQRIFERCVCLSNRPEGQVLGNRQVVHSIVGACAPLVAKGLDDNWSQVRYVGIVASGRLYQTLMQTPLTHRLDIDRLLLPRLCLNRHYLAEGVRECAQRIWKELFGPNGRELVGAHLADVVPYLVTQSQADNHAVREAACHMVAELLSRVDLCLVQPYADDFFALLITCFHDDSWPVRDCASSACATLASVFGLDDQPQEIVDELFALWFRHCADCIPSIRAHTAEAMATLGARLKGPYLERVFDYLRWALPRATEQEPDLKLEKSTDRLAVTKTTFDAIKQAHDNDVDAHSDQTMYSCGSLAPKMRSRRQRVGCMDCTFSREPEPWEYTDGALYLWRFLAQYGYGERCAKHETLSLIVERLVRLPVFHRLPTLWATLWTQFALALPHLPSEPIQAMLPTIHESMTLVASCEQEHVLVALETMRQALNQWEQT